MKQIIIHTDPALHAWLKSEAAINRRALGSHINFLLESIRAATVTKTARRIRKGERV